MIDAVANEGVATAPDGHMLAERYEALRREFVDFSEYHTSVRGLALLMRQGMAAWMKCVNEFPARTVSPVVPATVTKVPCTLEQNLIDIMATMALATALEVVS